MLSWSTAPDFEKKEIIDFQNHVFLLKNTVEKQILSIQWIPSLGSGKLRDGEIQPCALFRSWITLFEVYGLYIGLVRYDPLLRNSFSEAKNKQNKIIAREKILRCFSLPDDQWEERGTSGIRARVNSRLR